MTTTKTRVTVDGVALAVHRTGRGVPVVCLSAVGHDAQDFSYLAERAGAHCEFICIEWPGHGESGKDHRPVSASRYAELIEGVLSLLGIEFPIVLGNSIGGTVAMRYAARHRVRALVICDSGGLVEISPTVRKFCRVMERFFAAGERDAWWYRLVFAGYYRLVLQQKAARAQRKRIVANAHKLAPLLRQAWASFGDPEADLRAVAASLDVPIWVAWSKHDRVIPLKACMDAIRGFKHYTLDTFDGGHTPFLEQPDAFAKKFLRFLVTLSGNGLNNAADQSSHEVRSSEAYKPHRSSVR